MLVRIMFIDSDDVALIDEQNTSQLLILFDGPLRTADLAVQIDNYGSHAAIEGKLMLIARFQHLD